jgi:hypothetical protein
VKKQESATLACILHDVPREDVHVGDALPLEPPRYDHVDDDL